MFTRYVEWVEPFGAGNVPVICCVKAEDAIAIQRKTGMDRKPFPYEYQSDEQALEDFITSHWARKIIRLK